jgi:hypothetical protein
MLQSLPPFANLSHSTPHQHQPPNTNQYRFTPSSIPPNAAFMQSSRLNARPHTPLASQRTSSNSGLYRHAYHSPNTPSNIHPDPRPRPRPRHTLVKPESTPLLRFSTTAASPAPIPSPSPAISTSMFMPNVNVNTGPAAKSGNHFTTQHHRLAPTSVPPSNPSVLAVPSSVRLNEFFDLIKNEFETVSSDGTIWKAQRDQYEEKCECACS